MHINFFNSKSIDIRQINARPDFFLFCQKKNETQKEKKNLLSSFLVLNSIFICRANKKFFMGCEASKNNIATTPTPVVSAAIVPNTKMSNLDVLQTTTSNRFDLKIHFQSKFRIFFLV
jgi:hypothetical protein